MKTKLLNKFSIILLITTICVSTFASGYFVSNAEPIHYMTNEELDIAFRMYLQSRGGSFIGNKATEMVYNLAKLENFLLSPENSTPYESLDSIRTACRFERFRLEGTDSNSKWGLFLVISDPNLFIAYEDWLLQHHFLGRYLEKGLNGLYTGDGDTLYDGYMFSNNGGHALLYHFSTLPATETSQVLTQGTPIFYGGSFVGNIPDTGYTTTPYESVTGNSFTIYSGNTSFSQNGSYSGRGVGVNNLQFSNLIYYSDKNNPASIWGYMCLGYTSTPGNMYNVMYYDRSGFTNNSDNHWGYKRVGSQIDRPSGSTTVDVSLDFTINNNFNGDITNYPDVNLNGNLYLQPKIKVDNHYQPIIVDDDEDPNEKAKDWDDEPPENQQTIPDNKPPQTQPDVGGGDSTDGGNYGPEDPEDGTITIPDVDFELPDIDWSIKGLKDKFPFSIPFDLMAMFQVLNAEPQTPEIDATIDLKVVSWHIDYDLHQFDGVAQICRNLEFIAFCVSLILITRSLIKG